MKVLVINEILVILIQLNIAAVFEIVSGVVIFTQIISFLWACVSAQWSPYNNYYSRNLTNSGSQYNIQHTIGHRAPAINYYRDVVNPIHPAYHYSWPFAYIGAYYPFTVSSSLAYPLAHGETLPVSLNSVSAVLLNVSYNDNRNSNHDNVCITSGCVLAGTFSLAFQCT